MRIFFFGTGRTAERILSKIKKMPDTIEVMGFIDNNPDKWTTFMGKPVVSPARACEIGFDKIIIMADDFFDEVKTDLKYWFHVEEDRIKNKLYLLKLLMEDKYEASEDPDIKDILSYWKTNELSHFNQYVSYGKTVHTVQWDYMENMPYIVFEDKRMYYPYNYKYFQEVDGKKVVRDILGEQQMTSPHLYLNGEINIKNGDIIADVGVCEGNFALRYIESVSKAYLFECDRNWIRPLEKTFEKFKDKIVIYKSFLGREADSSTICLDEAIKGRLDFLKMDIEGGEVDALLGGRETFRKNDVRCAICSYHRVGDENAIRDILGAYGYKTSVSDGYMVFWNDETIYSSLDFRKGIVYAHK